MAKYTKRRDKRGYEWKSAYREKEALMLERGYPEVSPHDFYRELFPTGSLQQEPGDGKGNIIATQIRPSGKGRTLTTCTGKSTYPRIIVIGTFTD